MSPPPLIKKSLKGKPVFAPRLHLKTRADHRRLGLVVVWLTRALKLLEDNPTSRASLLTDLEAYENGGAASTGKLGRDQLEAV